MTRMKDWFTIEQVDEDTYAISEYQHWEETHCYLLIGSEKSLLIDSGLGVSNIGAVVKSIATSPVQVATTHVHWDHIGGHKYFREIAVHEKERLWLSEKFPLPLEVVKKNLLQGNCTFPADFDIQQYEIFQGEPTTFLNDGDIIKLGGRDIHVIHTPGHSPGHICFFEPERRYLFTGDLIYSGCLDAFYPTTDPFEFMQSVKKVKTLSFEKVLPGHHQLDIPVQIVNAIDDAFTELYDCGKLKQGGGLFSYSGFEIHI